MAISLMKAFKDWIKPCKLVAQIDERPPRAHKGVRLYLIQMMKDYPQHPFTAEEATRYIWDNYRKRYLVETVARKMRQLRSEGYGTKVFQKGRNGCKYALQVSNEKALNA